MKQLSILKFTGEVLWKTGHSSVSETYFLGGGNSYQSTSLRIIIHFVWSILQCSQYLWLRNISCRVTDELCRIWKK
jgi:hypothetical protein